LFFVVSLMHKLVYVCDWMKQHRVFVNDLLIFLKQHPNKLFHVCFFVVAPQQAVLFLFLLIDH
jgi:hypothetical protein